MINKLRIIIFDGLEDSEFFKKLSDAILEHGFVLRKTDNLDFFKAKVGRSPREFDVAISVTAVSSKLDLPKQTRDTVEIIHFVQHIFGIQTLIMRLKRIQQS